MTMNSPLADHLDCFLRRYFARLPEGLAADICRFMPLVKDVLVEDMNAAYVRDRSFAWDEQRLAGLLQFSAPAEAVFYYRLAHAIFVEHPDHVALPYLANLMRLKTGMELYYSTEIGPGFNVQHGSGIVIGPRNRIGSHFTIHQGVTIGQGAIGAAGDAARIGDHVTLYAGAKVVGNLTIGDGVEVGANAVLTKDAEAYSVYAGVPARKIRSIPRATGGAAAGGKR